MNSDLGDKKLQTSGDDFWIAPSANVIGEVILAKDASVWFNAVLRADNEPIYVGQGSNIQDGAIIHCTYKKNPTEIGDHVTIGHNAIVHGCTIKNNVLIGMGAVILDKCIIENDAIVAAGAVVTMGPHVKSGEIYAGTPAKKLKNIPANVDLKKLATGYIDYTNWYK